MNWDGPRSHHAVLAYVAQQAVENYAWLKSGEMLDGLGHGRDDA
jgi:hypothetical protein